MSYVLITTAIAICKCKRFSASGVDMRGDGDVVEAASGRGD
jgi:hypothetical protein